jgi:hypothetical protein
VQLPITIGLRRSRFLDAIVALGALLASVAVLIFPQSTLIQTALIVLIALLVVWAWRQLRPIISALRLEQSGDISLLRIGESDFVPVKILPGAFVHPGLSVVRFKPDDAQVFALIVTVDSLNAPDFRRLRVFLRWRADFKGLSDDA